MTDSRDSLAHPDLTGYIFGLTGSEERQAVLAHLRQCQTCAREVEELGKLPDLMGAAAQAVSVPSTLEQHVLDAVKAEETVTRTGRRPSTRRPAAGPLLRGALVRLGLGSVGRRLWAPGIAVAVGALVVLGAVGVVMARLAQPPSAPGAAQVQTVQLVAVDGSGASGTASIERASAGQVVELKVRGLPDTSPGELYVCWLVDEDDSMQHQNRVAVGTFRVSGSGPLTVRWSTGANTAQYRLDVTREKADGNPLRRGPEVLTAVS